MFKKLILALSIFAVSNTAFANVDCESTTSKCDKRDMNKISHPPVLGTNRIAQRSQLDSLVVKRKNSHSFSYQTKIVAIEKSSRTVTRKLPNLIDIQFKDNQEPVRKDQMPKRKNRFEKGEILIITGWSVFGGLYLSQIAIGAGVFASTNSPGLGYSFIPVFGSIYFGALLFQSLNPYEGNSLDFLIGVANLFIGTLGVLTIAFGLAQLAGLVTAITGHVMISRKRQVRRVAFTPIFYRDGAGIGVSGRF